jgi:predicted molibdopterin-dependent oxidoreductase YjgC
MTSHRVSEADDIAKVQSEEVFTIIFDGRSIDVRSGETIAGALLGSGITSWRTTRFGGRPRGVFCGIGVCFDCLVVVNGQPGHRACLRVAEPGDEIRTQEGAPVADES